MLSDKRTLPDSVCASVRLAYSVRTCCSEANATTSQFSPILRRTLGSRIGMWPGNGYFSAPRGAKSDRLVDGGLLVLVADGVALALRSYRMDS